MGQILNISLPEPLTADIKRAVRVGKFASTSEFFRSLVRDWLEKQALTELEKSRLEIASGHGKKLKSLRDLR